VTASPGPRPAATATVQVDNARVRVTEWRFAPDAGTGWHRHEHDYVVVPLTTGRLRIQGRDGETAADLVAGRSYYRAAGVEHDVVNASPHEFVFVEIEVKSR
jgi:quercetin dioxygenase-like cupin family protein